MTTDLEEEMRQALFGNAGPKPQIDRPMAKIARKAVRSRLRVTLRVGNEYEGKMFEFVHDVDTLSTLLAEQQATKAARKKYRFVELVSVKPI